MLLASDKNTPSTISGTWREGDQVAICYGVNVQKWDWAKSEGFTIEDVFDNEDSGTLYDSIFEVISPTCVVNYLA
jgi:hypothetical protein